MYKNKFPDPKETLSAEEDEERELAKTEVEKVIASQEAVEAGRGEKERYYFFVSDPEKRKEVIATLTAEMTSLPPEVRSEHSIYRYIDTISPDPNKQRPDGIEIKVAKIFEHLELQAILSKWIESACQKNNVELKDEKYTAEEPITHN